MNGSEFFLRPMSELQPSSADLGLTLVYVVDTDWDLWLLDASAALETPDEFRGWVDREPVARVLRDINTK